MIKLDSETVITLGEACRRMPRRRAGRPAHPSTLYRWADEGLRGLRLETIRVGGTLCTSVEALQRFFDGLTELGQREGEGGVK